MNKNNSKHYTGFIATIIALVTLSCVLTIGLINTLTSVGTYSYKLENMYQKSFSELITNVNNIEVDLSKIIASTGTSTREKLYNEVYTNCNYASSNLSNLPISYESINKTTKFINQMGGFSYYIGEKLKNNEPLTDADISSTRELYDLCKYIQSVLTDFVKSINYNFSILANSDAVNNSTFNSMFESMQSQNIKYPTLIYDGPFSESSQNSSTKGVQGEEIAKEDAERILKNAYNDKITNITFDGETSGLFNCYNFSFELGNASYYAQITKQGGLVLNITSYNNGTATKSLTLNECKSKAEDFAKSLSLNVESVWATSLGGIAYINLTPVVANVVIYPDMIKAKVSMQSGLIIGWEATSYAHNHTERTDLTTSISIENARKSVATNLTIQTERITLIPLEYNKETVAYEFKCLLNDATYYVYIDANSGEEIQVLKVVSTTNGDLLQ